MSEFAPGRERTDKDWIIYPSDIAYRKKLFPDKVFEHPAKAQLYLLEDIVEYVSDKGNTILDPFGGTGSMVIAAPMGRKVIMIEVEEHFVELIKDSIYRFKAEDFAMVIPGDNRKILPMPCHHAIFSPPYSNILSGTGMKDVGRGISDEAMKKYAGKEASVHNLGRLSTFLYAQHMKKVYRLLGESVKKGGTMTILIKDRMRDGVREHLSEACIKACGEAGFSLWEWHKWKAPGTGQQKLMKSKGFVVVEDEDILMFRKD